MNHIHALAISGALAAFAIATPTLAETFYYEDEGVTVTAPYAIHRDGGPLGERTVSVSRIVDARGLDLRYGADVDAFHRRVVDTARIACDEAEDATPGPSLTSDRECVRRAVSRAMPQFRAVVQRANYYRPY